jgi:NDP-sugar pyrophosphorylase family protein
MNNLNIVIPMAGLGTRFINAGILEPKPLIKVNKKYLIEHSVSTLGIKARYIFITRNYENENHNRKLSDLLKTISPESIEIKIDTLTSGATETVLYAKEYINNDNPLIITNCDQIINWNSQDFLEFVSDDNCDGAVVLFKSNDLKNSFAEINNNLVTKIAEKESISDNALVGIHYWKNGKDFVFSAQNLLNTFRKLGTPECYISETYNYLIENNKKIYPYFLQKHAYIALGTPEDLEKYNGKVREYYTEKPKTIFCDIDGTILKHSHRFSDIGKADPEILNGVLNKFNDWDSKGYKIILTTARKESARSITEKHLQSLGLCWDMLLMNMTSGNRFLINDKLLPEDNNRATAINLITDSGFDTINWTEYGL